MLRIPKTTECVPLHINFHLYRTEIEENIASAEVESEKQSLTLNDRK